MQNTDSIRAQFSRAGLENSVMGMGTLKGEPGEERSALSFFSILQEVRLEKGPESTLATPHLMQEPSPRLNVFIEFTYFNIMELERTWVSQSGCLIYR